MLYYGYLCAQQTNKQGRMTTKTTPNNINQLFIISSFLRSKSFAPIRMQYHISYNAIVLLLSAYLYSVYECKEFNKTQLFKFTGYYNIKRYNYYLNKLIGVKMITQAGERKYTITDLGLQTIQQISDNTDNLLYSFCDKYSIVL